MNRFPSKKGVFSSPKVQNYFECLLKTKQSLNFIVKHRDYLALQPISGRQSSRAHECWLRAC